MDRAAPEAGPDPKPSRPVRLAGWVLVPVGGLLVYLGTRQFFVSPPELDTVALTYLFAGLALILAPLWLRHVLRLLEGATELEVGGFAVRGHGRTPARAAPATGAATAPGAADQVAAVCYKREEGELRFLLILTDGRRRIFPKGGVDAGERPADAARREAREEAGALGHVRPEPLTRFRHHKRGHKREGRRLTVEAYLLEVTRTVPPLEPHRDPTWYGVSETRTKLAEDRELWAADELHRVVDEACAAIG